MPTLASPDLLALREQAVALAAEARAHRARIVVHMGTCGRAAGAGAVAATLSQELETRGITDVALITSGCAGYCSCEPMVTVEAGDLPPVVYGSVTPRWARTILDQHVLGGSVVGQCAIAVGTDERDRQRIPPEYRGRIPLLCELPFYRKQQLEVLRNRGVIDPEKIEDYVTRDGYLALEKALTLMQPEAVIEEVTTAGLRGRGGAGFPAGRKWELCRREARRPKYVIGNCDEGDPGAYMDRSLLESDPHAVLEGITIAAYAIGASKGYLYVRTEYPLAIQSVQIAIAQSRSHGLLGEDILGSGFDFDVEVREGSGAFVCGEETALIRSIEGEVPEPRQRPPFPVQVGLWGCPTVINNVETLANVPLIIRRSARWYAKIGTPTSKGTKIFSLVGAINNTGLIEVPMGITLREIVYDIGEGVPDHKELKAVQTGGPSGGCIPASHIDLPIDYESLQDAGSIMGSGGMIVMDEDTCMVDVSKFFIQFTNAESCGKCTTCRDGSAAVLEVLTRISEGAGKDGDLEYLEELCLAIKDASMCGLGTSLPNPVLSTITHFREEYEAHIREKRCPALVCKELITYHIVPEKCVGCLVCLKNCPGGAIAGQFKYVHVIDQTKCTKCGQCLEVCPPKVAAVVKLSGNGTKAVQMLEEPVQVGTMKDRTDGGDGV